ncbi:MAG: DNA ligase [Campylobacteraceae bacterium]|nr:DNA ligase [Campylobacteraceae bacterium]
MKYLIILLFFFTSLFPLDIEKQKYYKNQNITNWYMSEKLDGIRAYWNGQEFLSKNGNKLYAPESFFKNMPNFPLDGELWTKRSDFENIQSIVLDKKPSIHWNKITYNIFEAPNSKGDFKKRLEKINLWFKANPTSNVKIIKHYVCKDRKHLYNFLNDIIKIKGEGVIIKNPNLPYITKRTSNSLKVVMFHDIEGKVININFNKNNRMKSLVVQLDNGVVFNLGNGFTKEQRLSHPKIGQIVNFKHFGFTKNKKPRFASFLRVRKEE